MKYFAVLVVALVVVLAAQFPMEPLANQNDLAHWIQHGLLFWGGVAAGATAYGLYRQGQRRP